MSLKARKEYLERIHERYQNGGRKHKTRILDEFCANCGYHRKFALRLLNRPLRKQQKRPGPKPKYDREQLQEPLKELWLTAEQPCSKLLKATLPLWLKYQPMLTAEVRRDLLAMSAANPGSNVAPDSFSA